MKTIFLGAALTLGLFPIEAEAMNLNLVVPWANKCSSPQKPELAFYSPQSQTLIFEKEKSVDIYCQSGVKALGLTGATRIWRRDATDLGPIGPSAGGPFELVFLDPPYRKEMIPKALASLKDGGWLAEKALLVAETDANEALDAPGAADELFVVF